MLYTKFQSPTMPGTHQKVCVRWVGGCGGWLKPIIVFSLDQAEQNLDSSIKANFIVQDFDPGNPGKMFPLPYNIIDW